MFRKILQLAVLLSGAMVFGQTFNGATGPISDDGQLNDYSVSVSGLSTPLGASFGLVKVCLNITHTWDSDLNVSLIAPDGTPVNLFSGLGGDGDNFSGTCLSQEASESINQGSAPFTGLFRPQQTLGNVNNGQSGNGVWTLRILDTYPDADTGSVLGWSIEFGQNAATPFVFTSSNLPIVILNTGGQPIVDDPKVAATMTIISNNQGLPNFVNGTGTAYDIGIEVRGNYSQSLPQKPYKFETYDTEGQELDVSLLGMPEENDWTLISNYNDKVFMRNTMSYELFRQMGHYAARSQYCEVILNGDYQGIYMLMESLKRDNERIDIAKLDPDENSGVDVTGGYILKCDYWNWDDSWQTQFTPIGHPERDVHLVYEYPKPENITPEQQSYIQTFINDFETALYGNNFANPDTGYVNYIDTDSFIDYFIVNELARNIDGFRKSFWMHKDKDSSDSELSKLALGPVWDFDWAYKDIWSCSIYEATDGSGWAYDINDCNPDVASPGWHIRLLQDPVFANKLRCRWESFRNSFMSNAALMQYIDDTAALLQQAQFRHFERWGNLGVNTGTPEVQQDPATFAGQIAKFKDWISLRTAWLDANIPGTASDCALGVGQASGNQTAVFPNPARSIFTIKVAGVSPDSAVFFDVTGKRIMTATPMPDGTFSVTELANGVYFCRPMLNGVAQQAVKVVVLH